MTGEERDLSVFFIRSLVRWVGASLLVSAANAGTPSAASFHSEADIDEAVLSPSGQLLAVTSGKGQPYKGLVIIDLRPGGKAARIAQMSDGDIYDVSWVNDERLIFKVSDFNEGSARQMGAPGLFAVNPDGSQFRSLVSRMGTPFVVNGSQTRSTADARILDWNHRLIKVPAPKPGEANEEVLMAQFSKDEYRIQTPIWLNTRNGRTRAADVDPPANVVSWIADAHGEPRVAFTRRDGRQAAYWRTPGTKQWEKLYESTLLEEPFNIYGVDEAGQLYVTQAQAPDGIHALVRYDFARHAPAEKPLVVTPGFDFYGGLITDGSGSALGVRVNVDAEVTIWFDPVLKELQDKADNLLPGRVNRISCRRCAKPDMIALVRSYSDRDPGQLFIYKASPPNGEAPWTSVGRVNEAINPAEMAQTDFLRVKARDGLSIPIWITRPTDAKTPLPAVVLVHGGPWVRGRTWGWRPEPQFLATRGYVVIEPEMRGSTGYGDKHYSAGMKQWGQAMQDDVADALLWAQKQGIASEKACIIGASYGGYSALMGLINDPDLYRCGIAAMAVTDLDLYVAGSWRVIDDISTEGRKYTLKELVGDPAKDAALLAKYSPVNRVKNIKAPLMLVWGEDDKRVPIEHGTRLRDAMTATGNPPTWIIYSGEGHGFGSTKNEINYFERMESFLAKYLK